MSAVGDMLRAYTAVGEEFARMMVDAERERLRLVAEAAHERAERMKHLEDVSRISNELMAEQDRNEVLSARVRELEARLNLRIDSLDPSNDIAAEE